MGAFKIIFINILLLVIVQCSQVTINGYSKDEIIKPITVCEVLSNRKLYNGKTIALIGRIESTDEGHWISEDTCNKPVITENHIWRNLIWIKYDSSSKSLFTNDFSLNKFDYRDQLDKIKKQTSLRNQYDNWVIIYGKFESSEDLGLAYSGNEKIEAGYGHLNNSPAQIIYREKDLLVIK